MSTIVIPTPTELRDILHSANPRLAFWIETNRQVAQILSWKWTDQAVKRKEVEGITIDGVDTLDADDAIWWEKGKNGYKVFVTLTDISEVFWLFSPIDFEALLRAVSIYRHPGEIPMIPEPLSHDRFSLNGKRKHIGITVEFEVSFLGQVTAQIPYESLLTHRGKFTHAEAAHSMYNKDDKNHEQIALLAEISNLINRAQGRDIWLSGLSEESSLQPGQMHQPHMKVHKMIGTLMVTSNRIVANLLSGEPFWVYRQHMQVSERAFYSTMLGPHAGLWFRAWGYTHFTSPLRRYPDLILHRLLKAKLRKEPTLIQQGHGHVMLDHVNQRVFEIDTIQQSKKNQEAWKRSIDRIRKRHGRNPKAHELKRHIRRTAVEAYLLPDEVRGCILDDMQDPASMNWQWAVGIILLSNDRRLKESLREEVIQKRRIVPLAFLNSLAQTRLVLWEGNVFEFDESLDSAFATASMVLPDGKILSVKKPLNKKWNTNHIRWNARKDLMFKIIRHYISPR